LYNTIIIGAGPVGSYLAIKLTLLGHKVIVLEKKPAAGQDICCTGIISKECYDLLSIDGNIPTRQANSAKFFTPSGRHVRLWRNDEVAYITDRAALDQAMANKAQKFGVTYHFSTRVTNIEFEANRLLIKTNSSEGEKVFEAETAVITTGHGSDLPKNLGLGKINDFTIGAQAEININSIDEVEIYFDQTLSPGGFAWLVPTGNGRGLAGLITRHQPQQHLTQLISKLQTQGKISKVIATNRYAAIPLRPLPRTYTDRILVVGEAAGQVKPTTVGGIYYGIICADIAANVLHQAINSGDLSAASLSTYQKQWQAKLGRELTIGYWTQRLWAKLPNSLIEYLFNIAQKRHIPELVATSNNFSFDWHSQLLLQIAQAFLPFTKL
jgi:geranylgeranyl reductase family protein